MPDLQRFLDAQASTYSQLRAELTQGQKRSHWMWFIFPQIQGLGSSSMAQRYAIQSVGEAVAYLGHPILGVRLREVTSLVLTHPQQTVDQIFGYPDDLKFHSSMTLFAQAAAAASQHDSSNGVFTRALEVFFAARPDAATLRLLGRPAPAI